MSTIKTGTHFLLSHTQYRDHHLQFWCICSGDPDSECEALKEITPVFIVVGESRVRLLQSSSLLIIFLTYLSKDLKMEKTDGLQIPVTGSWAVNKEMSTCNSYFQSFEERDLVLKKIAVTLSGHFHSFNSRMVNRQDF